MSFEIGDRVLFKIIGIYYPGLVTEKLSKQPKHDKNDLYRVQVHGLIDEGDFYLRYYKSIKLDKQWYRNLKIDEVLNG